MSVDSHLEVSPEEWRPFVDAESQEYVPKVVALDDGGDAWLMPTGNVIPLGSNSSARPGGRRVSAGAGRQPAARGR